MSRSVRITRFTIRSRPSERPYTPNLNPWTILGFRPTVLALAVVVSLVVGFLAAGMFR